MLLSIFAVRTGPMLFDLLTWLDSSPTHYWFVAWSSLAVCVGLAVLARFFGRTWCENPIVFGAAMLAVLLAFRWPVVLDNRQYPDPDESQFIAEAATLRIDPVFWRSVDGSTHGPLTDLPLVIASLAGRPLDFTTARFVSVLLIWIELMSAWLIFRHLYRSVAGFLVLPLLAAHAFTELWSFVAYCSEHVPNTAFALASCGLLTAWPSTGSDPPRLTHLFGAGVFFGVMPFAKLQAAPIAVVGIAAAIWFILAGDALDWKRRRHCLTALIAGTLTIPTLMVGIVLCSGIWSDFFNSYILDNIRYAGANKFPPDRSFDWAEAPRMLIELGGFAQNFNLFALWIVGFGIVGCFLFPKWTKWHRSIVVFAAIALIVASCAAMAPGRPYLHYLQLILFPAGLFGGLVAGAVLRDCPAEKPLGSASRAREGVVIGLFLACALIPQLSWRITEEPRFIGRFTQTRGALAQSEVSAEILRHGKSGERLGVWGYMPMFWVETGLIQATRDAETSHQIEPNDYRDYYRRRFLRDLLRTQPPVFIDAVGPGNFVYEDRNEMAHETFSELRDYIANNYQLVRDIDGTRIYVRSDRL